MGFILSVQWDLQGTDAGGYVTSLACDVLQLAGAACIMSWAVPMHMYYIVLGQKRGCVFAG
jgi:hypothetical protein